MFNEREEIARRQAQLDEAFTDHARMALTESDHYLLELAQQCGAEFVDDDATVYQMTDLQIVDMCKRVYKQDWENVRVFVDDLEVMIATGTLPKFVEIINKTVNKHIDR